MKMEKRIDTEIRGVNTGEVEITWRTKKDIMKKDGSPDFRFIYGSILLTPIEISKINEQLIEAKKWVKNK